MIVIDGSQGEGGGQMVRSSLALSIVTQTPVRIENIRAGRPKPGLQRQHLTAVRAAIAISQAEATGAELGGSTLEFSPGPVRAGEYHFPISTAGSSTLVLQTVLTPLMVADTPTTLALEGGTHNPWAPCYDFVERCFLPLIERMGVRVEAELLRHGFHPAGGGKLKFTIHPATELRSFSLESRGRLVRGWCEARVANLPLHIAEREAAKVRQLAQWSEKHVSAVEVESNGPGNVVLVGLEYEHSTEMATGFGKQGVTAEKVAKGAWNEARAFSEAKAAALGPHLADQWMLPLALAASRGGGGAFTTVPLTQHSRTHLELIERFLAVRVETETVDEGSAVRVAITSK